MYQVKVTHNQGWPAASASRKVVKQPEKGQRPMLHNRNEQPEARKRQPRRHAKLTTGGKNISANVAAPGGVTVRHAQRTPVATDQGCLHTGKLA